MGITSLGTLYDGSRIRSFTDLQLRFKLPPNDFLKYAQISHLLADLPSTQCSLPSRVSSFLHSPPDTRAKGSRLFYDLLTDNDIFTKSPGMLKWEEELGKQFSEAHWSKALHYAHTSSMCANHREQYQKLLTRWYFTPLQLSKAFPSASPYCWRLCGSVGSLLHVFWSCPMLSPFWRAVQDLVASLVGRSCPFSPEFALLLIGIGDLPRHIRPLICNVLHAARLSIARHWKGAGPPTIMEVSEIVSNIFLYERTLAWHKGTSNSFYSTWSPWQQMFPNLC